MSPPRFLLDEHLPPSVAAELCRRAPGLQALVVGQAGAPAKGTPDSELLLWVEENGHLLITNNRASMPGHLKAHLADGHHIPGILVTPFPLRIGSLIEVLLLVWGATLPGEYQDQITYLPQVD
jgi:hypothetical protein